MINVAFAGFRHPHVFDIYKQAVKNTDVKVVAAYETDSKARKVAETKLGLKINHENYNDLLKDESIDVVVICDYYGIRGKMAIEALKAGKHIFSDKPLCISLEELDEIEKLSSEKGLKAGCLLSLRYCRFAQPVRDLIMNGELGEIHTICFGGQHPLCYDSRPQWYFEEGKHGGTINDIAIHGIDLVEYLTGLSLKKVVGARCWNAFAKEVPQFKDCAQFMLELTNGAGLIADVSYSSPDSQGYRLPFYWRFNLWGSKGVIEFSVNSRDIIVALDGNQDIKTIHVPDKHTGDCFDDFISEIKGVPTDLDTSAVLKSTRNTLMIQKFACEENGEYEQFQSISPD